MKIVWKVVPIENSEFQLIDHQGKVVGIFDRRLEIRFAGFGYIDAHRCEEDVLEIIFDGIDQVPSFTERWKRRIARWIS